MEKNEKEEFYKGLAIDCIKAGNYLDYEIGYIDENGIVRYFYPYSYFKIEEIDELIEKYSGSEELESEKK